MSTSLRARTEDVRALVSAIALGSGAGLLIGAAYLMGGQAAKTARPAAPAMQGAGQAIAQTATPSSSNGPAGSAASLATLRDRFRLAGDLTRAVARPFQFQRVADAPSDVNCLAEAVYFEARGEAADGQRAVAQVVLNRVRHPAFPKTICAVVHQRTGSGCQFTFACSPHEAALDSLAWRRARSVATAALHGAVMGAVGDATHFQTARSGPFEGLLRVAQVGAHVFYRFAGRGGAAAMFHQTPAPSGEPVRLEMARLDVAPQKLTASSRAGDDASKPVSAELAPKITAATSSSANLISKATDAKPPTPLETTAVLKPASSGVSTGAKAADTAPKPIVTAALAQS